MKRIITSKVAGVTYPDPRTGEDRQSIIAGLTGKEPCRLQPEPDNKYDPNAIAVMVATPDGIKHVGYVPRDLAKQVAPYINGENLMIEIVEITGGFETRYGDIAALGLLIRIELPSEENVL